MDYFLEGNTSGNFIMNFIIHVSEEAFLWSAVVIEEKEAQDAGT